MAHGRGRSRLQTRKEGQAEGRRIGNVNESGKGVTEVRQEERRETLEIACISVDGERRIKGETCPDSPAN